MKQYDWLSSFAQYLAKQEFSQTYGLCTTHPSHNVQHFRLFPAKSNDSILRKCWKSPFLALIAQIQANENFARKSARSLFLFQIIRKKYWANSDYLAGVQKVAGK